MIDEDNGFSLKKFLFGGISRKLVLGFLVIVLLVGIMGYVGIKTQRDVSEINDELQTDIMPGGIAMAEMEGYAVGVHGALIEYITTADVGAKEELQEAMDALKTIGAVHLEHETHIGPEEQKASEELNAKIEKTNSNALALVNQKDEGVAIEILIKNNEGDFHLYYDALLAQLRKHKAQHMQELEDANEAIIAAHAVSNRIILITTIAILILSITTGFFISRSITKPIKQLYKTTEEIEKGNFKARTDIKTGDELEQLGNSFNKTAEVLEQRDIEHKQLDKAKTEFLSITSHELRSPMTPMRAQLQMLEGEYFGKLNKKQRESIDIVLRNTERLDRIIMDFLEISRIEAARLKFNFMKTDLTKYINRVVEEMKGFMPEKKVEIISNIDKLPVIEVDPDRVMQVLRNLINNAIKFCKENCTVEISAEAKGDHILFSVKDQGTGISQKDQQRIFEPFYQAKDMYQRQVGGTGLGLSICRGIVESQNGKIWVESTVGKGAAFYFKVPFKPVREIKPIKILFSPKEGIEKKVGEIFKDMLGPLGSREFKEMQKKQGIIKENLFKYMDLLNSKGVISEGKKDEFKNKVGVVFGEKAKVIGSEDLKKAGLIKAKDAVISEKLVKKGFVKKEVKK